MKKNKYFLIISVLLIIIVCIVIYTIYYMSAKKSDNKGLNYVERMNEVNTTENTSKINNQTTNEFDIFYDEEETGVEKYTTSQLNNFSFEIKGMSNDLKNYINSEDSFYIAVKEFVYKHGLVDASTGNITKWELKKDSNKIVIYMVLDNKSKNTLLISVNLNNNDINVYKYE